MGLFTTSLERGFTQGVGLAAAQQSGTSDKFAELKPGVWKHCTAASLRGHIVNGHCEPGRLFAFGFPRYDVELATYLDPSNWEWVTRKVCECLSLSDQAIAASLTHLVEISDIGPPLRGLPEGFPATARELTPVHYRILLIKLLRYIDYLSENAVDWNLVRLAYPECDQVSFHVDRDLDQLSFFDEQGMKMPADQGT